MMIKLISDSQFLLAAEAVFDQLESSCDLLSAQFDLDCQRQEHTLTVSFAQHNPIVLSLQVAMHQIWVATAHSALHYEYVKDGKWLNTRTKKEFFAELSGYISNQLGKPIGLLA